MHGGDQGFWARSIDYGYTPHLVLATHQEQWLVMVVVGRSIQRGAHRDKGWGRISCVGAAFVSRNDLGEIQQQIVVVDDDSSSCLGCVEFYIYIRIVIIMILLLMC